MRRVCGGKVARFTLGDLPACHRLWALQDAQMGWQKSADGIVCAGQRTNQEGSSPSGAQMRGAISESGGNASLGPAEVGQGRVSTVRWNPKGMRRSTGP